LPNFLERKHPRKGEKKGNKGQGPKSRKAKSPTKACHKEEREPLRIKPSNFVSKGTQTYSKDMLI
jgi:hypothetical protein